MGPTLCPHCRTEVPGAALVCRTCLREIGSVPPSTQRPVAEIRNVAAQAQASFAAGDYRLAQAYAKELVALRPDLPALRELQQKLSDITEAGWDIPLGTMFVILGLVGFAARGKEWIGALSLFFGVSGIAVGIRRLARRERTRHEAARLLQDLSGS